MFGWTRRRLRPRDVPTVPYCIIWRKQFEYLRTMKVPEEWIPRVTQFGWSVLIRDSDLDLSKPIFNPPRSQADGYADDGA